MNTLIIQLLLLAAITFATVLLLFPIAIKISPYLGLVDHPDFRKFHQNPIPPIGGLVIVSSLAIVSIFSPQLRSFIFSQSVFILTALFLTVIGVIDDRIGLSPRLRLMLQLACALAMTLNDVRLISFYGFLGMGELPLLVQYVVSIIFIIGITNAFNLIDGIDGLAGSFALINICVLVVMSIVSASYSWLFILLPIGICLMVFLKLNWRPARIFMGDSGSLLFGFFTAVAGLQFIKVGGQGDGSLLKYFLVAVSGYLMVPVLDALRVFYGRMSKGKSPFAADRTHLHHLLVRHYLVHSAAAKKLIALHSILIIGSVILVTFTNIHLVIIIQMITVLLYMSYLKMMFNFQRWYRFIKRMELATELR